jgi:hypothetical protein
MQSESGLEGRKRLHFSAEGGLLLIHLPFLRDENKILFSRGRIEDRIKGISISQSGVCVSAPSTVEKRTSNWIGLKSKILLPTLYLWGWGRYVVIEQSRLVKVFFLTDRFSGVASTILFCFLYLFSKALANKVSR